VSDDYRALACNYAEPASAAAKGALAYVRWPNYGNGNDRVPLLARSRGGRWIRKWESMARLCNFRLTTIPPEHPMWGRLTLDGRLANGWSDEDVARFREACEREHARHSA
jgi:hypothetical protein